jgi:hypothetical protein
MLIGYRIANESHTNVKVPLSYINDSGVIDDDGDPNWETYYEPDHMDIALEARLREDEVREGVLPCKFICKSI